MKFKPFPELATERLWLRKIEVSDVDAIFFLRSDKTVNKFIERAASEQTKTKADALRFIEKLSKYIEDSQSISWGITLQNQAEIIGTICLWNFSANDTIAEVGYDLRPTFQQKGIMSEALNRVLDFGFTQLKLNKIEAFTHQENESSKKLLEKNGFVLNENRADADNSANLIFEISK